MPTPIETSQYAPVQSDLLVDQLPAWLNVNTGDSPSDTMYMKVISSLADALGDVSDSARLVSDVLSLPAYPRSVWRARYADSSVNLDTEITLLIEGRSITLLPVESQNLLLFSKLPTYMRSDDGFVYICNAAQQEFTLTGVDGDYTFSGPLSPDDEVYIQDGDQWRRLTPSTDAVDSGSGIVHLEETGQAVFRATLLSSLAAQATVQIPNNPDAYATRHDLWNPYDEESLLAGLTRVSGEDNVSLRDRIRIAYMLSEIEDPVGFGICDEMSSVFTADWDGREDLELAETDITGIAVVGLPRIQHRIKEKLVPEADNVVFTSSSAGWMPNWSAYVNGSRVTTVSYPDMTVGNGRIDFGTAVPLEVTATFSSEMYTVEISQAGSAVRKTANTPTGSYKVLYTRSIKTSSITNESPELLDDDGTPSEFYAALSKAAFSTSPVYVGVPWGSSTWLNDEEEIPQVSHLPVVVR